MEPEELSRQLRCDENAWLRHRRRVVLLSLGAAGSMGLIALYQIGIVRHLPEPPLPRMNADKVDASGEAYRRFSVGDAFLGFVSYGVTMALAAAGGTRRAAERPWLSVATGAKAAFDAAEAARLTVSQWTHHRAFCFWCLLAAGATFAALPHAWAEGRAGLETLRVSARGN